MNDQMARWDFTVWDLLDPNKHEPDPVVLKLMERLPLNASIFEYGAGRGRNAIPLAQGGFQLVAQDIWGAALNDLAAAVKDQGLTITTKKCDAIEYIHSKSYDAIACIRLLHFLKNDDAKKIIQNMQDFTIPGGWNAHSLFLEQTNHKPGLFFPGEEEIIDIYLGTGWTLELQSKVCPSKPGESTNGKIFYQKSMLFRKCVDDACSILEEVKKKVERLDL